MLLIEAVEETERRFKALGEPCRRLPPPSRNEMIRIERSGTWQPEPIRELYAQIGGLDLGPRGRVMFVSERGAAGFETLFSNSILLGRDDFGNRMIVDLTYDDDPDDCGLVFYICHDPPVAVIHSLSLCDFILSLPAEDWGKERSFPSPAIRDAIEDIWSQDPYSVLSANEDSLADDIPVAFIDLMGPKALITDLRGRKVGSGLSWGRFGAESRCSRVDGLIFGVAPPADGWLSRVGGLFPGR